VRKKRSKQEGSLHQLPSGSWRAQVYLDGQRISHTERTKHDAQDWLRKTQEKVKIGIDLKGAQITLEEFLAQWMTAKSTIRRRTTRTQYQITIRIHILPALGKIKLIDLRPEQIQKLYNTKLTEGLGPRMVEIIHSVLHGCLEHALKLGLISRNPTNATTPPRAESAEMRFYDEAQVSQFLSASQGERLEALYFLEIATGLRQSELLGLKWADIDWNRRSISIKRQLSRFKKEGYFTLPKTKAGRRMIILGANILEKLRQHWKAQQLERQFAGQRWQENDLVFPSTIGSPCDQGNLYRDFRRIVVKAGLPPIRFHDLRHTAASLMLNHNIPPIVVSRRLGHYKASFTLDIYGHLIPEMQDEAADLMDELIFPAPLLIAHELHTK
jgi:integrase